MRARRQAVEIVFDHATKRYPGRAAPAVDDLSLSIPAGEICCLVGPSGGGKTTAMKLVNRLVELTSGDVRIDGRSVTSLDETELRRGIGYVIQQVGPLPAHDRRRERRHRPAPARLVESGDRSAGRRAARPRRPAGARLPRPLRLAALRRRAPARRARPRPRGRPARDADGRAVRRPRPDHAHPAAERAAADPGRGRARRSSSSPTTSTRRSSSATGSRSCARAGCSPSTTRPSELLAHPADEFVARFVGADRGLKRLSLTRLGELELEPANGVVGPLARGQHDAARRALGDAERRLAGCSSSGRRPGADAACSRSTG